MSCRALLHLTYHISFFKDEEQYLIKWTGYSNEYNSWEPLRHLNCIDLLKSFHALRHEHFPTEKTQSDNIAALFCLQKRFRCRSVTYQKDEETKKLIISISSVKQYKRKVAKNRKLLKLFEKKINETDRSDSIIAPVMVENRVDFTGAFGPPDNFKYVNDYVAGKGVTIISDPPVGCNCPEGCAPSSRTCCPRMASAEFAYKKENKRLRLDRGRPIYECNKLCSCELDCPNRQVQRGRTVPMTIFYTGKARGWGVKTNSKIRKGQFVVEYIGEV